MIKGISDPSISILLSDDSKLVFQIPRYQREYTWSKNNWETIFDDLIENEIGYFIGSIVCINTSTISEGLQSLELVDGQQRLTTLSILLAAIYSHLREEKESLSDYDNERLTSVLRKVISGRTQTPKLTLQSQASNDIDYKAVLVEAGIELEYPKPANAGNRKIFRAFRYFRKRLSEFVGGISDVFDLYDKICGAQIVKIEVNNHSDAYVLFESLNNTGVPLTAIDLIKNKLLSEVGRDGDTQLVDRAYQKWSSALLNLSDEYSVQERFLRQYYNTYNHLYKDAKPPFVTRSLLIGAYEKVISSSPSIFLDQLAAASRVYSNLICINDDGFPLSLKLELNNLNRIQGTPCYSLLLFVSLERESLKVSHFQIESVVIALIKFFVRRNLTDKPATRDLDRIFISIISDIRKNGLTSNQLVDHIRSKLVGVSSSAEDFRDLLHGDVYDDNPGVTRFLLCSLEQAHMTKESERDLWRKVGNQYLWTIEHIFPQGQNIPQPWVDMIADGDIEKASACRDQYVHKIGNLTISGYNSSLGNKSFG